MKIEILNENNESLRELLINVFEKEVTFPISNIDIHKALNNNVRFLCAINNEDKIIGTIMITTKYNPVLNINSFYLDYISVLKEYKNQGIIKQLLKYTQRLAKKEEISYIEFTSSRKGFIARNLYSKGGFEIRDTDVFIRYIK